jgi:hypothetical protein
MHSKKIPWMKWITSSDIKISREIIGKSFGKENSWLMIEKAPVHSLPCWKKITKDK